MTLETLEARIRKSGQKKILAMDGGRIVESGTHQELLAAGGLYTSLYEKQFRAEISQ